MTIAYALNEIRRKSSVIAPHTVFEPDNFERLEELGAVRRANEAEVALYKQSRGAAAPATPSAATEAAEESSSEASDDTPTLKPKHKGGGKFVVVDQNGDEVGDHRFDGRDEAQAWIDAQAEQADLLS